MNFENFNQGVASEKRDKRASESLGGKLKKTAQIALVTSAVAVGAVGCGSNQESTGNQADKPDRFERQSDLPKDLERNEDKVVLDREKLDSYYKAMKEGNFGVNFHEMTRSRAIELAMKKGIRIQWGNEIVFDAIGGVPVKIKIDGQYVPINSADYTQEEIKMVKVAQSLRGSSSETPGTQEKSTDSKTNPEIRDFF